LHNSRFKTRAICFILCPGRTYRGVCDGGETSKDRKRRSGESDSLRRVGSRLWPLSRKLLPKQFARILQGQTLFERTVQRNLAVASSVMIAANRHQAFLAFNQMENLGISEHFGLIEPIGRNTAPAMALAAMLVEPETIMLVTPSDHLISKDEEYAGAVKTAVELAAAGRIVTFGIEPDYPETGFGYIEAGSPGADAGDGSPDGSAADPYAVRGFREKPDAETAAGYLEAGNYYWNSGMFCFRADVFLSELKHHAHDVYEASFNAFNNANGLDARRSREPWQPMVEAMHAIPAISVDYAVMEKSDRIAVVPCDIGWSDLGSLDALYDYYMEGAAGDGDAEAGGNASAADTEPVYVDANRNLVIGEHRQVALIDVDELMVVETPDALLIAKKGSGQKVKEVVEELQGRPGPESRLTERFPPSNDHGEVTPPCTWGATTWSGAWRSRLDGAPACSGITSGKSTGPSWPVRPWCRSRRAESIIIPARGWRFPWAPSTGWKTPVPIRWCWWRPRWPRFRRRPGPERRFPAASSPNSTSPMWSGPRTITGGCGKCLIFQASSP
jgi:mannose-1-phosphate guanylyltransferase